MALNSSEVVLFGMSVVGRDVIATARWGMSAPSATMDASSPSSKVRSGPRLGPKHLSQSRGSVEVRAPGKDVRASLILC